MIGSDIIIFPGFGPGLRRFLRIAALYSERMYGNSSMGSADIQRPFQLQPRSAQALIQGIAPSAKVGQRPSARARRSGGISRPGGRGPRSRPALRARSTSPHSRRTTCRAWRSPITLTVRTKRRSKDSLPTWRLWSGKDSQKTLAENRTLHWHITALKYLWSQLLCPFCICRPRDTERAARIPGNPRNFSDLAGSSRRRSGKERIRRISTGIPYRLAPASVGSLRGKP
jgi:hypothetical protein